MDLSRGGGASLHYHTAGHGDILDAATRRVREQAANMLYMDEALAEHSGNHYVRAFSYYEASDAEELTLHEGDIVRVLSDDLSGWLGKWLSCSCSLTAPCPAQA